LVVSSGVGGVVSLVTWTLGTGDIDNVTGETGDIVKDGKLVG
jgi:hypothetical protein